MAQVIGGVQRGVGTGRDRVTRVIGAARARWRWFDHLGRSYERYQGHRGDRLAAAVTYFGFLAFFPLLALAYSVTGYLTAVSPAFKAYLTDAISSVLPGLAAQLPVEQIAQAKAGAGLIGLVGLLYAGLGWVDTLREALRTIWSVDPGGGGNFFVKKAWDLAVLVMLGVALVASVGVSSVTVAATHGALEALGFDQTPGAGTALRLLALAVAIGANMVIFLVLFTRLSGTRARWRYVVRGALFGAVGFEVLKLVGAYLVSHTTRNPLYASFAVVVGLLVWINLVSRFTLYAAAWTATRRVILRADADNPERIETPES